MKKILLASLLVTTMIYNAGCESEDVALGVIAVGVGIGLSGMDNDHHDRGHYNDGRYDRRDDRWEDRYDRRDRRDDRGPRRGRGYYSEVGDSAMTDSAPQLAASSFSQKHNITPAAGAKIQKAFANVSQSGLASFEEIGLNERALKSIMNRSLPDNASIRAMSQELSLSETQSRSLLQNLVSEFDQQASNFDSNYWNSCKAKGQWKTPQNAYCKTGDWSGCSPSTGATLCY